MPKYTITMQVHFEVEVEIEADNHEDACTEATDQLEGNLSDVYTYVEDEKYWLEHSWTEVDDYYSDDEDEDE